MSLTDYLDKKQYLGVRFQTIHTKIIKIVIVICISNSS